MSPKYPRTPHLPWSPGGTSDDRRLTDVSSLLNVGLILTEKMDGSNVCLEASACYARSHAGKATHPSFDAFKAFHAGVAHLLPEDFQVFGEWLYAKHSISYKSLPCYFMAFGVRDMKTMLWGAWSEVEMWAAELGVQTAPVLAQTALTRADALKTLTDGLSAQGSACGGQREGIVVRHLGGYSDKAFNTSVAKWVRQNHVQTEDPWKNQIIVKNTLA
jgi:hypothetical protein